MGAPAAAGRRGTVIRWIAAADVGRLLRSGMTVFVAGATAEPREMLQALATLGGHCAGVRFISVSLPGLNGFDFSTLHPEVSSTAFFATAENRESIAAGRVEFIPLQYGAIYRYLERELHVDAVLLQLPPADERGASRLGISADFAPAVLDKAGMVIGEINQRQIAPLDSPLLPPGRLDYAIACDRPVPSLAETAVGEVERTIGRNVAELIRDGDCLQSGIGAIPDAVMSCLSDKNELGIHSGMISDAVMTRAQAGNITGSRKTLDKGRLVTGATLGSPRLVEWAGRASELSVRPVGYTHDCGLIRRIDNFVSINSALQVDLFGQVNAEVLDGRQFSATGGSVDMMRGAALSRGGRSVVALGATAQGGRVSRIVAALAPGTPATALRTDVDYVVTEFGARQIRYLPASARAAALIEIAHPDFRARLRDEWRELSRG